MSLTAVCNEWVRSNPGFTTTVSYDLAKDRYKIRMTYTEEDVSALANLPARPGLDMNGVIEDILETLRNQILFNVYYGVVI